MTIPRQRVGLALRRVSTSECNLDNQSKVVGRARVEGRVPPTATSACEGCEHVGIPPPRSINGCIRFSSVFMGTAALNRQLPQLPQIASAAPPTKKLETAVDSPDYGRDRLATDEHRLPHPWRSLNIHVLLCQQRQQYPTLDIRVPCYRVHSTGSP
jgi:hypothetical protein